MPGKALGTSKEEPNQRNVKRTYEEVNPNTNFIQKTGLVPGDCLGAFWMTSRVWMLFGFCIPRSSGCLNVSWP